MEFELSPNAEVESFSLPVSNGNYHLPMRVGATTPRRRKSSIFLNDHSPFQLSNLSTIECQSADMSPGIQNNSPQKFISNPNQNKKAQVTRMKVVVTPDIHKKQKKLVSIQENKPDTKKIKSKLNIRKIQGKENIKNKSNISSSLNNQIIATESENITEKELNDDIQSDWNQIKEENQMDQSPYLDMNDYMERVETPRESKLNKEEKKKKKKNQGKNKDVQYFQSDKSLNDSGSFGPFKIKKRMSSTSDFSPTINQNNDIFNDDVESIPNVSVQVYTNVSSNQLNHQANQFLPERIKGPFSNLNIQTNFDNYYQDNYTNDELPIITLEQAKRRESQAIREFNQKLISEKKINDKQEREKKHQLIMEEKEARKIRKKINAQNRIIKRPSQVLTVDQLESPSITPRPFSGRSPSPGVSNRITEHMKNIRRKSAHRRISSHERPMASIIENDFSSRAGSIQNRMEKDKINFDQNVDNQNKLYNELPEEYETRSITPLDSKIEGRPISGNVYSTGAVTRYERRTYSTYPTVIRYDSEVYQKEKEETSLIKHIRNIQTAEQNTKKATIVRMEKIRAKESRIKWEHEKKFELNKARNLKENTKKELIEKKIKQEEERSKIKERIQIQKKLKEEWKEQREFFKSFSCHHNLISKQLVTRKIKDEREKDLVHLHSSYIKKKQEIEEKREQLQNMLFNELNRKRAMATFVKYQTKKNLEKVDSRLATERKRKVLQVKEWKNSKKFINSEYYEDYSILKKMKSKEVRDLEFNDQDNNSPLSPHNDSKAQTPQSPKLSPHSSPNLTPRISPVIFIKQRPKSAILRRSSLIKLNYSDEEYDANKDPQRPSSAHAPLKVAEFGD